MQMLSMQMPISFDKAHGLPPCGPSMVVEFRGPGWPAQRSYSMPFEYRSQLMQFRMLQSVLLFPEGRFPQFGRLDDRQHN
jgi:hypothetical protein